MKIRNVLLAVAVIVFVIGYLTMPDGCASYTSDDNVTWVCEDPTGFGLAFSHAARLLFAGLAALAAGLIDYDAIFGGRKRDR